MIENKLCFKLNSPKWLGLGGGPQEDFRQRTMNKQGASCSSPLQRMMWSRLRGNKWNCVLQLTQVRINCHANSNRRIMQYYYSPDPVGRVATGNRAGCLVTMNHHRRSAIVVIVIPRIYLRNPIMISNSDYTSTGSIQQPPTRTNPSWTRPLHRQWKNLRITVPSR